MEHTYRYAASSVLSNTTATRSSLALATAGGVDVERKPVDNPFFFTGTLREPAVTASGLTVLAKIVASNFAADRANLARLRDPVVTSGDGVLRFEVFSGCSGLYARLDVTDSALNAVTAHQGTTNVDFNDDLLSLLRRLGPHDDVGLSVGDEAVTISRDEESVIEKKVPLPERWVRGFAEAAAIQSRMEPAFQLTRPQAIKFLNELRRGKLENSTQWLVPSAAGVRTSRNPNQQGVPISAWGRLAVLRDLTKHAGKMIIYRDPSGGGASGWELTLGTQRLTVILSPGIYRGFSGEGQTLQALVKALDQDQLLAAIDRRLNWQNSLSAANVATLLDVPQDDARNGLLCLGCHGLMGYDFSSQGFFHRELPYDRQQVEFRNPRLTSAQELVANNAVRFISDRVAVVDSGNASYRVELQAVSEHRCNCEWYAKHRGTRGSCKHVLAALIVQVGR